ncbi:hypothetical protein Pfo_005256 [Paulownia fortunei]|nr:hypothetical protein Pfo_005256 [Paulownia fortunei]
MGGGPILVDFLKRYSPKVIKVIAHLAESPSKSFRLKEVLIYFVFYTLRLALTLSMMFAHRALSYKEIIEHTEAIEKEGATEVEHIKGEVSKLTKELPEVNGRFDCKLSSGNKFIELKTNKASKFQFFSIFEDVCDGEGNDYL